MTVGFVAPSGYESSMRVKENETGVKGGFIFESSLLVVLEGKIELKIF